MCSTWIEPRNLATSWAAVRAFDAFPAGIRIPLLILGCFECACLRSPLPVCAGQVAVEPIAGSTTNELVRFGPVVRFVPAGAARFPGEPVL